jgi:hypothetical protein
VIVIVNAGFAVRFRDREPASPDFREGVDREPPAAGIVIETTES